MTHLPSQQKLTVAILHSSSCLAEPFSLKDSAVMKAELALLCKGQKRLPMQQYCYTLSTPLTSLFPETQPCDLNSDQAARERLVACVRNQIQSTRRLRSCSAGSDGQACAACTDGDPLLLPELFVFSSTQRKVLHHDVHVAQLLQRRAVGSAWRRL